MPTRDTTRNHMSIPSPGPLGKTMTAVLHVGVGSVGERLATAVGIHKAHGHRGRSAGPWGCLTDVVQLRAPGRGHDDHRWVSEATMRHLPRPRAREVQVHLGHIRGPAV